MPTTVTDLSNGKRWFMYVCVLITCISMFFNMFKAPTLFPAFIETLGFTPDNIGLMMSMFTIMGIVLAFPAGFIVNKLGIKLTLLITTGAFVIGSVIGTFATESTLMLGSRFIEGIGCGLGVVVAPAAITAIIPRQRLGFAMGAYGIVFPVGNVVAMNMTPALYNAFGWQAAWWAGAVVAGFAFILVFLFFKIPAGESGIHVEPAQSESKVKLRPDWIGIALCALAFGIWNYIWGGGAFSFYPTFLQTEMNLDVAQSGFITGIPSFLMLFLAPLSGLVSDKLNTRKWLIVFSFVGTAIMFAIAFTASLPVVYAFVVIESVFAVCVTTGVYSLVPELARSQKAQSYGISLVTFLQNIGIFMGGISFGPLVSAFGWSGASQFSCVPMAILMAIAAAVFIKDAHKSRRGTAAKEEPQAT
ncbi:MAG: MFS transporter [Coriobacteriales bacterium]|jgi:MFS family permease|nr:MFS transporter [Coriobacteriales bacterium]